MAKGDVYHHNNFRFHDGEVGQKYIVVLNDSNDETEPFLVSKTTTNLRGKAYRPGCNPRDGVFFVSSESNTPFFRDTLIQIRDIYEFSREEFLRGSLVDKDIEFYFDLPQNFVEQIVNCIKREEIRNEISIEHFNLIVS